MSLLDYAQDPDTSPNPLPSLAARRRSGSWPAALLPLELVADDLTRFGYRYRRGHGFTAYGSQVADYAAANAAALVLNMAADALEPGDPAERVYVNLAATEAEIDRIQAAAHEEAPHDYEAAEELFSARALPAENTAQLQRAALDRLKYAPGVDHGDRYADHVDALRRTARDLKASATAQTRVLQALRRHLPAPDDLRPAFPTASAFLASLDGVEILKRSELIRRYRDAGEPGDLRPTAIRELAADRWRNPVKLHGVYVYRPTRHAKEPSRRTYSTISLDDLPDLSMIR